MISILLPCYKSESLLKNLLYDRYENVFRHEGTSGLELILYDNGGNGSTLQTFKHAKVIGDGNNIGLNAALNACANVATGEYFYLPHTDMFPAPGFETSLLRHAKSLAPGSYLFCSRSIERQKGHTPFHIIEDYGDENQTLAQCRSMLEAFKKYQKDKSIVTAYRMPFFMHRKLWEKMGGVDANLFSYATDDDLFLAAYDVGVRKFWMINESLVYHMQGRSNAQQTVDRDSDKPYQYLREKWSKKGYNMNQPLDQMMQSLVPWNLKVA